MREARRHREKSDYLLYVLSSFDRANVPKLSDAKIIEPQRNFPKQQKSQKLNHVFTLLLLCNARETGRGRTCARNGPVRATGSGRGSDRARAPVIRSWKA